jgi:hypothetical protein
MDVKLLSWREEVLPAGGCSRKSFLTVLSMSWDHAAFELLELWDRIHSVSYVIFVPLSVISFPFIPELR